MQNTMTGNRVLLKIEGKTIGGGVQNVDFSDDLGLQDVDGTGSAETQELVIGKVSHTISLSHYFVYNKLLTDLGFIPGRDEYLTSGAMQIEVIDKVSGETIELYEGCKAASYSRTYGKHTLSTGSATFRALSKQK